MNPMYWLTHERKIFDKICYEVDNINSILTPLILRSWKHVRKREPIGRTARRRILEDHNRDTQHCEILKSHI
jgi:hypothetical protein